MDLLTVDNLEDLIRSFTTFKGFHGTAEEGS
jgi:hypothetical protein